jgi:site-specific DNA-methyltransferase (adenine-specific)
MIELNKIYNEDCLEGIKRIPNNSVDCILTDPPYLYLKNQKLDRPFDEQAFFSECKRVLKKDSFIVLFGRGTSFYRWNCILSDIGFTFKEEIVWNKGYCTSPLMNIHRVHETISIHTNGSASINKVKIPYLEMKKYDITSILQDINRLRSVFTQSKSLKAVEDFLKNNIESIDSIQEPNNLSVSSDIRKTDRCVSVIKSMNNGMNEKSIIRTDRVDCNNFTKFGVNTDNRKTGDRCVNVVQSMEYGMNEKSIIKESRNHYKAIHPTEKPVRLLERLLNLVCNEGCTVLDPFSGSASTAIACINTNRNYIGFELDKEYYDLSITRINNVMYDRSRKTR